VLPDLKVSKTNHWSHMHTCLSYKNKYFNYGISIQHFRDGDCVHIYKEYLIQIPIARKPYFYATNLLSLLIYLTYVQKDVFFLFFLY
jgi:hypothetical protein